MTNRIAERDPSRITVTRACELALLDSYFVKVMLATARPMSEQNELKRIGNDGAAVLTKYGVHPLTWDTSDEQCRGK